MMKLLRPSDWPVFVCIFQIDVFSTGNPTSRIIPNSIVEKISKYYTWGCVVVDEAYIDFSGTESACCLVAKYPNVVVLQTLSKLVLSLHLCVFFLFPILYLYMYHLMIRMNNYVPILERLGWLVFDWAWPSRKSPLYSWWTIWRPHTILTN